MTYAESAALMNDLDFRGRIKVSALSYASYIYGESPSTEAHNSRYKWAQYAYQQPDSTAQQIQSPVVMEPGVQSAGSSITDSNLDTAVQTVVNRLI